MPHNPLQYVLVDSNISETELNRIMRSILLQYGNKNIRLKPITDKQLYNKSIPKSSIVWISNTSEYANPKLSNGYIKKEMTFLIKKMNYNIQYFGQLTDQQIKLYMNRRRNR